MFFEDAINVSRDLELTLTGKSCGLEERVPMCGVPYHAAEIYINKLLEKGYTDDSISDLIKRLRQEKK